VADCWQAIRASIFPRLCRRSARVSEEMPYICPALSNAAKNRARIPLSLRRGYKMLSPDPGFYPGGALRHHSGAWHAERAQRSADAGPVRLDLSAVWSLASGAFPDAFPDAAEAA